MVLNLLTGFSKSLIFQMTPLVHAEPSQFNDGFVSKLIVTVISPLVSLMKDQTNYLRGLGIKAESMR